MKNITFLFSFLFVFAFNNSNLLFAQGATPSLTTVAISDITANTAPIFTSKAGTSVNEGDAYNYIITTNDEDGDAVTITAPTIPSWLSFSTSITNDVSTFAGSGTVGASNGTGTQAQFNYPYGVAMDAAGNLYVADESNFRIRKITAAGVVTTLAGSGIRGFADGTGTEAQFGAPSGIAVDILGNVYVSDLSYHRIRKITAAGVVSTLAGSSQGFADGSGATAKFGYPTGLAVDVSGNVYVADALNNRIRKITPSGVVSTLAGTSVGFEDGPGTSAQFNSPWGVAVNTSGDVFVADAGNHKIRKITSSGVVTTIAGSSAGSADGQGTSAQFFSPIGIALDASGNLYVASEYGHRVRKITSTGLVTTLAGSGGGFADGLGASARFNSPHGLAVDAFDNVYVSDYENHRIRFIASGGTYLSGVATGQVVGSHSVVLNANDGNGGSTDQSFTISVLAPPTVTSDDVGKIAATSVVLGGNVTLAGGAKITERGIVYAKTAINANPKIGGTEVIKDNNGTGTSTFSEVITGLNSLTQYSFAAYATNSIGTSYGAVKTFTTINTNPTFTSTPVITVDPDATYTYDIATSDVDNDEVTVTVTEKPDWLSLATIYEYTLSTHAGGDIRSGWLDGPAATARFKFPKGIAMDANGNVYVADYGNNRIRKITPDAVVTTFAGSGVKGANNDGTGTAAGTDRPRSLAIDAAGNLFVVSVVGGIRKITPEAVVTTLSLTGGPTDISGVISVDINNNIYLLQSNILYKISEELVVTTLAGSGTGGFVDGTGAEAQFNNAPGGATGNIAVDGSGNVYVADAGNGVIRKVSQLGVVTTLADGTGSALTFNLPRGIAVDAAGNVYVLDSNSLKMISPSGVVTDLVGASFSSTGFDLAVNASGTTLYTSEEGTTRGNSKIGKIERSSFKRLSGTAPPYGKFDIVVNAADGKGGTAEQSFTISVNDLTPPVITSPVSVNFAENGTGTAYAITATDNSPLTYSLGTGNDEALFNITPAGVITFKTPPNFENALDGDGLNNYVVNVIVRDLVYSVNQNVTITVTDVNFVDVDGKSVITVKPNPVSKIYGESDQLTYSITSGDLANGDTYESVFSGSLTMAGVDVGTYTIQQGDLAASAGYTMNFESNDLTITPKAIEITADAVSRVYGDDDVLTYQISNDVSLVGLDAFTGSLARVAGNNVGTYAIERGTLALSSNYTLAFISKDLTITQRPITVTANALTKALNAADPTFTYAVTTGSLAYTDAFTGSLTRVAGETLGDYAIQQGSLALNANYTLSFVGNNLTISNFIDITVKAVAKSKTYGDDDPEFTYEITSGALNGGDTFSGSLSRVLGESVGDYEIQQGSLALSATYIVTFEPANLTISKKALTVTADNKTRVYGAANPEFTISYTGFIVNEDLNNIDSPPVASSEADSQSPVGEYEIVLSEGEDNNYLFNNTAGILTIGRQNQTMTFRAPEGKVYGDEALALTAISSVGLEVNFRVVEGPARIRGINNLTITGAGEVTIQANQAGNANYTAAQALRTFTVAKAPLQVTAEAISRSYGAANPELTLAYEGFVGNDDAADITPPTASTTADETSPVVAAGYPIVLTGGSADNYELTLVDGLLTVEKADLIATANNVERVFGEESPTLTISYEGFVNSDTEADITAPSASTAATITSANGIYDIELAGGSAQNYALTLTPGTLTVGKARLIARADGITKPYGEALPTLTISYEGFTNGDTEADIQPPVASTEVDAGTTPGIYAITLSGGAADNYELVLEDGELEVTKAPLTVTADDKQINFGEAIPALSISYDGFIDGEDQSLLDELPTATSEAVQGSNAGEYAIVVAGGASALYHFIYAEGVKTINKLQATITVGNLEQVLSEEGNLPEITTDPEGLDYIITFDGSTDIPTTSGEYEVVVTIDDLNYEGSVSGTLTIDEAVTAIEEVRVEVSLYPNPVRDQLTIEVTNQSLSRIEVYNLNGILMMDTRASTNKMTLDMQSLIPGVYMLRLWDTSDHLIGRRKLLKE